MHASIRAVGLALGALTPGLAAQAVVVPSNATNQDATAAAAAFPGTFLTARQQFLLAPSWLSTLPPQAQLTAASFRRDGNDLRALASGRALVTVRMSSQAANATAVAEAFAGNHGADVTTVHQGQVVFPASPALTHRDAPDWGALYSFTIPFAAPFRYAGGALCFDVEGTPLQSTRWPIDYHADLQSGRVQHLGAACGPIRQVTLRPARVSDTELRPGASMQFRLLGQPTSLGVLLLGVTQFSPPIPLDFLGATGCQLHLDPMLAVSSPVTQRPGRAPSHPGIGEVRIQMPHEPGIVGSNLLAQWLNVTATGFTASQGLHLTFAGGLGNYGATTVLSERADGGPTPAVGRVMPGYAPVVRLQY